MKKENVWKSYNEEQLKELQQVTDLYKELLDLGKTERECIAVSVDMAKKAGYRDLNIVIANKETLKTGDKVYSVCMDKSIVLYQIGEEPIENGLNILGAHVDSPRIDVKQNPLYEDTDFAYLDTHYYGGVKKYQWVTIPLAIHGVVIKKDGTRIDITIGEKDTDPVFAITDLLIHLSQEQLEKKANKVIEGENLDLLIASTPLKDEDKDAVKANVLKLLKESYDIEEEDFLSAELEIVPAGKARDCGLDRSMILGYGQDDRACSFTSLMALLEDKPVKRTSCCLLVDKEEIGSVGATGMHSMFFENSLAELMDRVGDYSELKLRRALQNSKMLSSDVSAAYDPLFASAYEKKNSAFFGKGIVFNKFTGSRGKSGSNDANPEYIAHLRNILDNADIAFQTAELGKVDLGGGGTIAYILARYGMEVIDSGVAVLCMHAPWEITSKADIYEAKKCYRVFLDEA
ncbi:MAG: aminopeptidase [bacterium]